MERAARNHYQTRGSTRGVGGTTVERDLLLQWGNRKRLRCVKGQRRDFDAAATAAAEKAAVGQRRAAAAAAAAQHHHRALRNSEESAAMTSSAQQQQQNNVIHTVASLNRECQVRASNNHHHNGASAASPDDKKGASSGSEGSVWPKFEIGLTNKEKEEDFLVLKGSKLPQRPKKRAKVIQRTINLVCPGTWLCDLTLERYEVHEKKVSKKRPRGLKSMQNLESDSD